MRAAVSTAPLSLIWFDRTGAEFNRMTIERCGDDADEEGDRASLDEGAGGDAARHDRAAFHGCKFGGIPGRTIVPCRRSGSACDPPSRGRRPVISERYSPGGVLFTGPRIAVRGSARSCAEVS